jgi:hypothetical protein
MSDYQPLYMRFSSSEDRAAFLGPDAVLLDKTTVYEEPVLNQMVPQAAITEAIEKSANWEQFVRFSEASAVEQCIFNAYLGRMTARELKRIRLRFSNASQRQGAYLLFWILWVIEPLYPSGFLLTKDDEKSCEQQLQVLLHVLDFSPPQEEAIFFKLLLFKPAWIKKLPFDDWMPEKGPEQLVYWARYGFHEMSQAIPKVEIETERVSLPLQAFALLENNAANLSVWGMVFLHIYPDDLRFLRSMTDTLHFNIYNGLRAYFHHYPEHLRALRGLGLKHTPLSLSSFLYVDDMTLQSRALSLIVDAWLAGKHLNWDQNECLAEILRQKKPVLIEKLKNATLGQSLADHILSHWCKHYDQNTALPGIEHMKDPDLAEMFNHLIVLADWQRWVDLLDPSISDAHFRVSNYQGYFLLHQYTWNRERRFCLLNTLITQKKWRALTFVLFYCLKEKPDFESKEISHWLACWHQSTRCFSEDLLSDMVMQIDNSNYLKGSSAILLQALNRPEGEHN